MPQVPYQPYPNIPAPLVERPQVHVETPAAAFGANIGAALEHFGTTWEHVGDQAFSVAQGIQDLANENTARQQSIAFGQEVAQRQAAFDATEGKAKTDALPGHLKYLEEARLSYREGLNPKAAHLFDAEASRIHTSFMIDSAKQAARALKEDTIKTSEAKMDLIHNTIVDPYNDKEFGDGIAALTAEAKNIAATRNWNESEYKAFLQNQVADHWAKRIRQVGTTDTPKAFDMLEANKAAFGAKYEDAKEYLQRQYDVQMGHQIAEDIKSQQLKDPSMTVGEAEANLKKTVADMPHTSKSLGQQAMTAYRHLNAIDDDVSRRDLLQTKDIIERAILDNPDAKTANELFLKSPEAAAAAEKMEKLKPGYMNKLPVMIKNVYDGRNAVQNREVMNKLWGMANGTSEQRQQFLEMDQTEWPKMVGDTYAKQLITKRAQLMQRPSYEDERLPELLRFMNHNFYETLPRLHLDRPPPSSASQSRKENYAQYIGTMLRMVDDYQRTYNKPPDEKALLGIGNQVLREIPGTGGWWGLGANRRFYQTDPKIADELRSAAKARGIELSPDDIQRGVLQRQLEILHHEESRPPKPTGKPEAPSPSRPVVEGSPVPAPAPDLGAL